MTEVAAAYVTLIPTAKGFRVATSREINKDMKDVGKEGGEKFGDGFNDATDKKIRFPDLPILGAARLTSTVLAATSLIGPLSAALVTAGNKVIALGQTAAALTPLLAFGPALAGSFALVSGTLTLIGPAIAKSFQPVTVAFKAATDSAAKLATVGLGGLAKRIASSNLPILRKGIESIGVSSNKAILELGRFVTSAAGLRLTQQITRGTSEAFAALTPKIVAAVEAFGRLALRSDTVGFLKGLGASVGSVADRLTAWANSTSAADIRKALSQLGAASDFVAAKIRLLQVGFTWLVNNEAAVRGFANAIGVLGLALSISLGSPIGIAVGAISLLINNWNTVTAVFSAFINSNFAKVVGGELSKAFEAIKRDVLPALRELQTTVTTVVVPALSRFVTAITPIVAWLVNRLTPAVSLTFQIVVRVISGSLKIIAGFINLFSGLYEAKWSTLWEGIKQIFVGAWQAIEAIMNGGNAVILRIGGVLGEGLVHIFANIDKLMSTAVGSTYAYLLFLGARVAQLLPAALSAAFRLSLAVTRTGASQIVGAIKGLASQVTGAVSGFNNLLVSAGQRLIQGLIDGVLSKLAAVKSAISSVAGAVKGFFPGSPVREGPLRSWNNGGAGKRLIDQGLIAGLDSQRGAVREAMLGVAASASAAIAPRTFAADVTGAALGDPAPGSRGPLVQINGPVHVRDEDEMARRFIQRGQDAISAFGLGALGLAS